MIFLKLSVKYWREHWKRLLTLITMIVMGAAVLCLTALFIRSDKMRLLNRELDMLGNYDAVFYEVTQQDAEKIADNKDVDGCGYYRELGYAGADGSESADYKVISFPDTASIEMYHMSCVKGTYPVKENEIAVDAGKAKELGVAPMPGSTVKLQLFDYKKKKLMEKKFTICGIFQISAEGVWGGYYRYPDREELEDYVMPTICVSDKMADSFHSSYATALIQADQDMDKLVTWLGKSGLKHLKGYDVVLGRSFAFSYILGITAQISNKYGEMTVENALKALKNGDVWKDFYSSVVIPLFGVLMFVVVTISVVSMVRSLLEDRSKEAAVLRSIGMTRIKVCVYLFVELFILILCFTVVGIALGGLVHILLVRIVCPVYGIDLPLGFHPGVYVASVTVSPWIYALVVMMTSSMISIVFPLIRMGKMTPIALMDQRYSVKKRKKKQRRVNLSRYSWRRLVGARISFHDPAVLIILCVLMGTCFLGYNYFHALADKNNVEEKATLEEAGLDEWYYTAEKTKQASLYDFAVENHHDYGIEPEVYEQFRGKKEIKNSFARIVNKSTRLTYTKKDDKRMPDYLSLRTLSASKNKFRNALYEAQEARIKNTGYTADEKIYSLPSVGVQEEDLKLLSDYIDEGTIDPEKIKSGEEVLIVIPKNMQYDIMNVFQPGDTLPVSDIALTEQEEQYMFSSFRPQRYHLNPVYKKMVTEPDFGKRVELTAYAVGKRKNIRTKIGAVVMLNDEKLLKRFCIPYYDVLDGEPPSPTWGEADAQNYAMTMVCMPQSFGKWGLPDRLYTEVDFDLNKNADLSKVDQEWYQAFGKCKGISYNSTYEIHKRMQQNIGDTMFLCYIMMGMLIVLGIAAAGIKFYSRIQRNSKTIAKLRALGMPLKSLEGLIMKQNLINPLIGAVVSLLPVSLCQMFFLFIRKQLESGAWGEDGIVNGQWYYEVPYIYNLFGYHPVAVLLIMTGAVLLLTLLATLPQIYYIRKQSVSETIRRDTY